MTIATRDDISTEAAGPDQNGKWIGLVLKGERSDVLVSTSPVFETKAAALEKMDDLVAELKGRKGEFQAQIEEILGPDKDMVASIVAGSQ